MSERQYRWLLDLAILVTLAAMLVIVLSPSGSAGAGGEWGRGLTRQQSWIVHAIMFGGWGLLISLRLSAHSSRPAARTHLLVAFVVMAVVGALMELAQTQVESRSPGADDWLADTIGAAIGLGAGLSTGRALLLFVTRWSRSRA